jgi:trimeric autotransporter adhesin
MKINFVFFFTIFTLVSYAQNSGIGTENPGSKLEIVAQTCDDTKSALNVKDSCNNSLLFIYNTGKIGVGTNTPAYKLSLVGSSSIANQTIGINNVPVVYLLNQSTNAGSIAFGNGLRNSQSGGGVALRNTALGVSSLNALTTGNNNTANGYGTLNANTTGSSNVGLGTNALGSNTTGDGNVAVGNMALNANTTGIANCAIGNLTLSSNVASYNTAFGASALQNNTTGGNNTGFGFNALKTNTTGSSNTAIGNSALFANTTGSENIAIGSSVMSSNTTGQYNAAIGFASLGKNTSGGNNVAIGYETLRQNLTGGNNVGIGTNALYSGTTAYNNISIGANAGQFMTTGGYNIIIGSFDGYPNRGISTGSNNILIGKNVSYATSMTSSDQLNIGNLIFSPKIGANDALPYHGRIGISTADPKSTLEVGGSLGYKVVSKNSYYNADEEASIILVDATNAVTINLPDAAVSKGRVYTIKKISGSSDVSIQPNSNTIDGTSGIYTLSTANQFVSIISDGANWFIVGK